MNNIIHLLGTAKGQMRTPIAQRSGFTRVAKRGPVPVPERVFLGRPDLANADPSQVTHRCEVCGVIEPLQALIGQTGQIGYLRNDCACERSARELRARQSYVATQSATQAQKAVAVCYSWLGKGAEQKSLESKTFENFDPGYQSEALQDMLVYAADLTQGQRGKENRLLAGANGVGKTHLACATLNLLRKHNIPCLFATVPHFFDALYACNFEARQQLINRAVNTGLLVFDELDKLYIKPTEDGAEPGLYQQGVLGEIVNGRYLKGLPTIITTNEVKDLKRWLSDAARSRLGGNMISLTMSGVDYRRKKR